MNRPPKRYLIAGALLLSIILVCAIACTMAAVGIMNARSESGERDHEGVHEALGIEEGEIPELEELERVYSAERIRLEAALAELQAALSKQLLDKSESDQEVVEGVSRIHHVHGKIQELSIQHYFDMLAILPEAKKERLRELAAESLSAPSQ